MLLLDKIDFKTKAIETIGAVAVYKGTWVAGDRWQEEWGRVPEDPRRWIQVVHREVVQEAGKAGQGGGGSGLGAACMLWDKGMPTRCLQLPELGYTAGCILCPVHPLT